MPADRYKYADVRTVFSEIESIIPKHIDSWSEEDIALNSTDLLDTLTQIRQIIDGHLQIRRPHIEFGQ